MKVLIDTCVIIDLIQKREPFFEDAHGVFLSLANRRFEGAITAKSVTDIYYLTHRFLHDNVKTKAVIESLLKLLDVADTAGIDCKKALLSQISDYEDALMVETAKRSGFDGVVTRNLMDYGQSAIRVFSPAQFLKELEETEQTAEQ